MRTTTAPQMKPALATFAMLCALTTLVAIMPSALFKKPLGFAPAKMDMLEMLWRDAQHAKKILAGPMPIAPSATPRLSALVRKVTPESQIHFVRKRAPPVSQIKIVPPPRLA